MLKGERAKTGVSYPKSSSENEKVANRAAHFSNWRGGVSYDPDTGALNNAPLAMPNAAPFPFLIRP
jgi:hypothetical protein